MTKPKENKVLIIDDEKSIARALMLKLQKEGFKIDVAFSGKEALPLLTSRKYSLVLLDLIMPDVDGFKILEILKESKNDTPVVILSNLGDTEYEKRSKDLGADGFYVKSDTSLEKIVKIAKSFIKE